jgi:hypothetical protein
MEKIHIGIGASEADHRVIEPPDELRGASPQASVGSRGERTGEGTEVPEASGVGWIAG